ncbi:GntR family transcriptional regulator [Cetobacterium sp. 8H]|uniref:GntR family transcriptional regulator n=1 Tax=Cetobacterium sp. 8H TaxID=2759681 RepID=UPI00163B9A72|nr:GntR family transcriptional regulator [Cetobacterium sp. 8H]MBC2850347.1 GntR family transcriptional regulator [Cetobacterium sp. 8H]
MANQTDFVYEEIRKKIILGEYKPNENLTEIFLANSLNASRNTIKKALIKLENENLILLEKNKGARVKSFTLQEVLDCFEVRLALEILIIRKVVQDITEEQLQNLAEVMENMKACFEENNLIEYSKNNQIFHRIIYDSCSNKVAVKSVEVIKNQLDRYKLKTILIPGRKNQSINEHILIVEALKERNIEKSEEMIKNHIENIAKALKDYYSLIFN